MKEEERKQKLENIICLLPVDYRFAKLNEDKFSIKLTRDVKSEEIAFLKKIGFKKKGELWQITIALLEEYLEKRYEEILKFLDDTLKNNHIQYENIELNSPFFYIWGNINAIFAALESAKLKPEPIIKDNDKVIINVWQIRF